MEVRVQNVVSSLEIGSEDVRMIGIKGIGGGGKTTLATAVFDHISVWFEGTSFVENVREVSKSSLSGLKELQKQVLSDVLNDQNIVVKSVHDGKSKMKKMMGSRKVLVVLDDVDDIDQLEALAGEFTWFKPGSRIIITTRDEQVLIAQRVNFIHDVSLLSGEEALCLFSRYAFGREIPDEAYAELSRKVVSYADGLPLTIKVLGSHLCGKSESEWVDAIERLKIIPLEKTLKRLEISYDGLENDEKEIFLDVVCILKGVEKYKAIRILESCGFNAKIGLRVLEHKSLITISNHGFFRRLEIQEYECLGMHDHIEEMAGPDEPNRHSRLWIKEEIEDILVNESGTESTRSLKLMDTNLHSSIIMKGLRNMRKLRFFHVVNNYKGREREVDELSQSLPDALRYLYWEKYSLQTLPKTFQANKLINLEMRQSNITELWGGGERKVLNELRLLQINFSKLRTFDLRMTPYIEHINLEGCKKFVELHLPVECPNLTYLNLRGSKVTNLNIGMTPNLEELDLEGCKEFVELHLPVECPNLTYLNLRGSKVTNLNIGMTPHLEELDLGGCTEFVELHLLTLSMKEIKHLPDCICLLINLKHLNLKSSWFLEQLPKDIGRLECLEKLILTECIQLRDIPESICRMKSLIDLDLRYCILVEKLPEELGQLQNLLDLDIEGAGISRLPQSIFQLKSLRIYGSRWRLESYGFRSLRNISGYRDRASCNIGDESHHESPQ